MRTLEELCAALLLLAVIGVGAYQWALSVDRPAVYGVVIVEAGRE